MKKSEFLKERREFILRQWGTAPRKDADAAIEGALRVAVNHAEAAGVEWDPEEPELPRRLIAYRSIDCGPLFNWHIGKDEDAGWKDTAEQGRAYEAAVAAYNREQEEEAFDAEHGAEFSAAVEEVCRGEVDALVAKKVQGERDRCERLVFALKTHYSAADVFDGRTPVRDLIEQYRLAIEQGTTHEQDLPPIESAWTGADDLPNPEPSGACTEPAPEWPETLSVDWRLCGALGEMPMLYPPMGRFWPHRERMGLAYQEAARRWEAEPELRARIDRAMALARGSRGPTFGRVMDQVERILTGKES